MNVTDNACFSEKQKSLLANSKDVQHHSEHLGQSRGNQGKTTFQAP